MSNREDNFLGGKTSIKRIDLSSTAHKDHIPYVLTVLSSPDGFPWIIFSPSKAHLFTNSSSLSPKTDHPCWLISKLTESEKASRAAESATQNAADEPKPEPRGSSELTTTVAGLKLMDQEDIRK